MAFELFCDSGKKKCSTVDLGWIAGAKMRKKPAK